MGKYFVWLKQGDARDISFRKKRTFSGANLYHVFVGEVCIGQVSQGRRTGWDVVSYRDHDLPMDERWNDQDERKDTTAEVNGFGSRLAGAFYLADHWKLRPERFGL